MESAVGTISRLRKETDRGNALIMVIGLGFAFVIIGITLAIATTFAASTASNSRAAVQAQGAADGGVDSAINYLNNVEIGTESNFVCSIGPTQTTTAHGTSDVMTTVKYRKEGAPAGTYACDPSVVFADGTDMVGAEITSTATLKTMTANGPKTTIRTVQQTLQPDDSQPVPSLFEYGVFSDAGLNLNNDFTVNGGGLFTNGNFDCKNGNKIFGPVTALGNATLSNTCALEDLTIGGKIECSPSVQIDGNVFASSVAQSNFSGCTIDGDVTIGGNFKSQATSVSGNVLSATGKILQEASSSIDGWAQAGTTISGEHVGGTRVENSPTTPPAAPAREDMPPIYWSDLEGPGAGSPDVQTVEDWLTGQGANPGGACPTEIHAPGAGYKVGNPSSATVIDARNCDLGLRASNLELQGDVTFVVKSWNTGNGFEVTGEDPDGTYKLSIVVPLPPGMPSCSGSGNGNISHTSNDMTIAPEIDMFVYTNGNVVFSNTVTFTGSIYACKTTLANGTTITYEALTPPGMGSPGDTRYNFKSIKRFDVR